MKKNSIQVKRSIHRFTNPKDGSGFSMLEAVVVVGVLLALAVGGFFAYGPITQNAKIASAKSAASATYTAVMVSIIDGDPTTNPQIVVDTYNSSQGKIKVEILQGVQPAIAAMSTTDYVPQSDNDFCVRASVIANAGIFAEMGNCAAPEVTPSPIPTETPTPTPTPAPYVDPTPTKTILTYKCDAATSGNFPFNTISQGTLTVAGSDGSNIAKTYTNVLWADSTSLKAGVTYTVTFDGKYNSFNQGGSSLAACIRSFDHWGEQSGATTAPSGMSGASKLISVPEHIPSTVTNLSYFFYNNTIFNDPDISKWNVSNVTTFKQSFYGAKAFNQSLNDWNVAKANDLSGMFLFTDSFDKPLDNWSTSNVTNMSMTFTYAKAFNQNINNWDVSKVTTMNEMFKMANRFDQPLDKWNVANVTTMDGMFRDATVFNQDIGTWRPAKVTDMDFMFASNSVFRYDLSAWTFNVRPTYQAWAPTGFPTTSYPKF